MLYDTLYGLINKSFKTKLVTAVHYLVSDIFNILTKYLIDKMSNYSFNITHHMFLINLNSTRINNILAFIEDIIQ
jgi:hypothetical protein